MILGYEWMKQTDAGTLGRVTTYEKPLQAGLYMGGSPPATKEELLGFFEHIEAELDRSGFFNPPEKRPSMVQNLRTMFSRMGATEQEVRTLRGIVKARGRGPQAIPTAIIGQVMPRYAHQAMRSAAQAEARQQANSNKSTQRAGQKGLEIWGRARKRASAGVGGSLLAGAAAPRAGPDQGAQRNR